MNNLEEEESFDVCHLVVEVGLQLAAEVADVHHIHCELVILTLLSLFLRQLEGDVVSVHGGLTPGQVCNTEMERWNC